MFALLCSAMVVTCVRFELISLASALRVLRSAVSARVRLFSLRRSFCISTEDCPKAFRAEFS